MTTHNNKSLNHQNQSFFNSIWGIYKYCFSESKFILIFSTFLIFISGILESIGFVVIIPIIEILTGKDPNDLHFVSKFLFDFLNLFNIPLNLIIVFILFFVLITLKSLAIIISNNFIISIVFKLSEKDRIKTIDSISNAEWRVFPTLQTGLISNTLNLETQGIAMASKYLILFLNGTIQSIVYISTAFIISFTFSFGAIIGGFFMLMIFNFLLNITKNYSIRRRDLYRNSAVLSTDFINNIKAFKAMNLDKKISDRLLETAKEMRIVETLLGKVGVWVKGIQEPVGLFFLILLIIISVEFFGTELGALIVSIALFYRVFGKIGNIQTSANMLLRANAEIKGVEQLVSSLKNENEKIDNTKTIPMLKNRITVSSLFFYYDKKEILNNINCEIQAGKITGLIGPSGSGKTSFIDLIIGLQEPTKGEIFIDNHNIKSLNMKGWRNSIGYVPQTFTLLFDTIRYNITLGDPSISENDLYRALELSGALDFVNEFPDKIDESIGQSGQKISGGQMQRLALARALVRNPQLLVLDEATSALDPETEKELCKTFSNLKSKTTIIAISHRSSIEEISDVIYHLNYGKIEKI